MKPLAIIGLDPGTTTAYAIIDLDAGMIKAFSGKNLTLGDIISQIVAVCQPVITATDKAKLPSFVEEFSRKVGTKIFVPEEDLLREDKRKIVLEYFPDGNSCQNDHEKDSLASALFAYRKYFSKIQKIKQFIFENDLGYKEEEFVKMALLEDINFNQLKNILMKPREENKIIHQVLVDQKITKTDFLKLYQKLAQNKDEKAVLEEKINQLKKEISSLKKNNKILGKNSSHFDQKIDQLLFFKDSRIKVQVQDISSLKNQISSLNQKLDLTHRFIGSSSQPKLILLKKLNNLSQEEWNKKKEILDLQENDFLLVKNPNIYSELVVGYLLEKMIILFSPDKPGRIIRENFAFIPVLSSDLKFENEYFALVLKSLLERKKETDFIDKIVAEHKERN